MRRRQHCPAPLRPPPWPAHLPCFAPHAWRCACAPAWHMLHTHPGPCLLAGYNPRLDPTHGVTSHQQHRAGGVPGPGPACRRAFSDACSGARRILKYAGCSEETFILALIYMDQARARPARPPPARHPTLRRCPLLPPPPSPTATGCPATTGRAATG